MNTNVISLKMEKHGFLDQVPLFRMMIDNEIPYLGNLPHSPIHVYLRMEKENIVEIKLMDSPLG